MRRTNQALLWVGVGVLTLTPCALGRSIREDYTALRGVSNIARADFMWVGGKSIFIDTDHRIGRTVLHDGHRGTIATVEHDGHATLPEKNWGNSGNNNWSGNSGNNNPIGLQNGPGSGPSGDFANNGPAPSGPGGNMPGGNMPGGNMPGGNMPGGNMPGGNMPGGNMPGGNTMVPEGGASASYVVPAGFFAFAGIFLSGFRRREQTNF
jgi:hypothetical protein